MGIIGSFVTFFVTISKRVAGTMEAYDKHNISMAQEEQEQRQR